MIRITPICKPFNKAFWKGVQQPDVYGDNHLTMGQLTTETVRAWDDPALSSRTLQLNLCSVFVRLGSVDFFAPYFQAWKKGTKKTGSDFDIPVVERKFRGIFSRLLSPNSKQEVFFWALFSVGTFFLLPR